MTTDLRRVGVCCCGTPVVWHYGSRNEKVSCLIAARRFQQDQVETAKAAPPRLVRETFGTARPTPSFFGRRLGMFHE